MKVIRNILFVAILVSFTLLPVSPFVQTARAQTILCDIFPFIKNITLFDVNGICSDDVGAPVREEVGESILSIFRLGVSLIFIGIIIIAVYVVIKAAVKYIQSEGDDEKIKEAQKSIKSAFVGLIALFVGIVGLVLILVLFNATDALNDPNEAFNQVEDPFI